MGVELEVVTPLSCSSILWLILLLTGLLCCGGSSDDIEQENINLI